MIQLQIKKKKTFHLFYFSYKQQKLLDDLIIFLKLKNWDIFFIHFMNFFLLSKVLLLKSICIRLQCILLGKDLDLFKREIICLILIWLKVFIYIKKVSLIFKNYKINILRSPFVNNKSGEHLKINYYKSILAFKNFFNLIIYSYFNGLFLYIYEFNYLKIVKLFI